MLKDGTPSTNRECKYFSNCSAGQYISTKGTSTTDRKCKACFNGQFSTNKNEDDCALMTTCIANQYILKDGTTSTNRECKYFTNCSAGQYISTKGTSTTDRKCKICNQAGTGTDKPNSTECDDCPSGKYNDLQVKPKGICKQCPQGQFAKEKKSKQCVKCPGNPPCLGRGDCDNKIGACINCKDGWTGKACEICTSPWLKFNGECTSCEPEYDKINGNCLEKCAGNEFRREKDNKCTVYLYVTILRYIGYVGASLSACALLYKFYIFIKLKRNGKLRKDLGVVKGFLAVIVYGGKGDHIIVPNDDNTMEENLLGEEERISDDDDMLEMPTVRESFSEILNTAGLSKYKPKFAKHGIQSTSHLDDIVEEDLEELGLSGFQRRQFKKAVTNV